MPESNNIGEPKTCESCGETFGCGAKLDGCWCSDVHLPTDRAAQLKAEYQDCLCPKCLELSTNDKEGVSL